MSKDILEVTKQSCLLYLNQQPTQIATEHDVLNLYERGYINKSQSMTLIESVAEGYTNSYQIYVLPQSTLVDMKSLLSNDSTSPWEIVQSLPHPNQILSTFSPYFLTAKIEEGILLIIVPLRIQYELPEPSSILSMELELNSFLSKRYNVKSLKEILISRQ